MYEYERLRVREVELLLLLRLRLRLPHRCCLRSWQGRVRSLWLWFELL